MLDPAEEARPMSRQESARMLWFGVGDKAKPKRPAAGLLIYARDTGRICLTLRAKWMNDGLKWSTPGGVYDDDDGSLLVTAFRETEEEIGVCLDFGDLECVDEVTSWNLRRSYTVLVGEIDYEFPFGDFCDETEDADWFYPYEALELDLHHQLRPIVERIAREAKRR